MQFIFFESVFVFLPIGEKSKNRCGLYRGHLSILVLFAEHHFC